jgi:hypothetical protein
VGVVLGAVVTGGDAGSRAAALPPPVVKADPVVERGVLISSEWVGTLVGYLNAEVRPAVRAIS